jgi:hypothetical protein
MAITLRPTTGQGQPNSSQEPPRRAGTGNRSRGLRPAGPSTPVFTVDGIDVPRAGVGARADRGPGAHAAVRTGGRASWPYLEGRIGRGIAMNVAATSLRATRTAPSEHPPPRPGTPPRGHGKDHRQNGAGPLPASDIKICVARRRRVPVTET